ncbi:hypothetical protein KIL84_003964 [Mauremys mutica]|uniref:Uncharacterized protein n=1 Tax=Mauremys mutica TaxID=74926 RepID=A0A9D4AU05_9SAUR|nr:hypothetical protein KIL84_003964 [Mauremys mutica]
MECPLPGRPPSGQEQGWPRRPGESSSAENGGGGVFLRGVRPSESVLTPMPPAQCRDSYINTPPRASPHVAASQLPARDPSRTEGNLAAIELLKRKPGSLPSAQPQRGESSTPPAPEILPGTAEDKGDPGDTRCSLQRGAPGPPAISLNHVKSQAGVAADPDRSLLPRPSFQSSVQNPGVLAPSCSAPDGSAPCRVMRAAMLLLRPGSKQLRGHMESVSWGTAPQAPCLFSGGQQGAAGSWGPAPGALAGLNWCLGP